MYKFYTGTKKIPFEFEVKEKGKVVPLNNVTVDIDIFINGSKSERRQANIIDSTNGLVSIDMDFNISGYYEFQAWLSFSDGSIIPSDKDKIHVK